ncbi:MAG: hypothetical protein IPP28_05795 [Xanthomonadales bacterium]|nr:hypothetical protein [Xanthomonadales bacterium]
MIRGASSCSGGGNCPFGIEAIPLAVGDVVERAVVEGGERGFAPAEQVLREHVDAGNGVSAFVQHDAQDAFWRGAVLDGDQVARVRIQAIDAGQRGG